MKRVTAKSKIGVPWSPAVRKKNDRQLDELRYNDALYKWAVDLSFDICTGTNQHRHPRYAAIIKAAKTRRVCVQSEQDDECSTLVNG